MAPAIATTTTADRLGEILSLTRQLNAEAERATTDERVDEINTLIADLAEEGITQPAASRLAAAMALRTAISLDQDESDALLDRFRRTLIEAAADFLDRLVLGRA